MKLNFFVLIIVLLSIQANAQVKTQTQTQVQKPIANLLVGTYTQKGSKGIYVFNFDTVTGKAIELSHTDSSANPEFLAITKDKRFVYAVNETKDGMVSAFSFKDNKLNLLIQKTTKGEDPCYLSISPDEHTIFVANYNGGSITQYHRFADGLLSNPQQFIQHVGKSVNEKRQDKPHVHGAFLSPKGDYLLTPDLGMDQVTIYPFSNSTSLPLDVNKATVINSKPGSGPRHLAFTPNGKYIYVAEELSGSISVYKFNKGQATFLQTVFTHVANYKGVPGTGDIHVSPDGKFVYVSNRGDENNIAKFPILSTGKLNDKQMQLFSTIGKRPRNITMRQDGNWLLVANQDTDNIIVFKVNKETGDLTNTGNTIKVSMPVCLVMF